jgi:hypothetical protein
VKAKLGHFLPLSTTQFFHDVQFVAAPDGQTRPAISTSAAEKDSILSMATIKERWMRRKLSERIKFFQLPNW